MAGAILQNLRAWNQRRLTRRRQRHARLAASYPHVLGVLGIMKNESTNIDEWIAHYLAVGAGKIYLIDNGSSDDTLAKAKVWVDKGVLELIELPGRHRQVRHYQTAIRYFGIRRACQWLLIADLDEFWFCPDGSSLPQMLGRFDGTDVIYANWRMFGSSGLVQQPDSIRCGLIHSAADLSNHIVTKYIVRTRAIGGGKGIGIHKFKGADSARTVSDNHNFNLNHYPIQSLEFFQSVKIGRGSASTVRNDTVRDMDYFRRYDAPCTQENRVLADLVISGRLGKGPAA